MWCIHRQIVVLLVLFMLCIGVLPKLVDHLYLNCRFLGTSTLPSLAMTCDHKFTTIHSIFTTRLVYSVLNKHQCGQSYRVLLRLRVRLVKNCVKSVDTQVSK